jgi:uncharacterized protein YydD (DUF2326 family)
MIRRVWSSLPHFREATFDATGMNVVMASRSTDSDETESTNGLGKSTLLRIIQFALGSDLSRDRILSHPALTGVTFGIDLEVDGRVSTVSRNTASAGQVSMTSDLLDGLGIEPDVVGELATISVESWRLVLADLFIPDARTGTDPARFSPSFRDLAPYFARLGKEAYVDPQQAYKNQSGPSKRLSTSYLLGLNTAAQRGLQSLIGERDRVTAAVTALGEAADVTDDQSIGDLEAERVVLERAFADRQTEIAQFNLRGDYHELEQRLRVADRTLHDLINDNYSDRRLLDYYESSAQAAPLFDTNQPLQILKDAGAVFAPSALQSLEDIAAFHRSVYQNRAEFLAAEIRRLVSQIAERSRRIDAATGGKSDLLKVLASSGAIETLMNLQRTTMEMSAALEGLKARIEERKRFDRRKDDLNSEIASQRKVLKEDLEDRRSSVDEAIELFADYTRALYGVAGKLAIDVTTPGYRFSFSIDRQESDGVSQMVVFCFDLMVATLRARRGARFLSLIHDSSLFADVDPRQHGLALQLADKTSTAEGFQYVCCLNEGAVPDGHLGDLDLDGKVRLRLTDDGDTGRLLGLRLPPRDIQ